MMPTVETANSLFQQPWWLDATSPGGWGEAVVERGGEVVARLPYTISRRYGLKVLGQPPLTLFLGPWLAPAGEVKTSTRIGREKELLSELIDRLPPHDIFAQTMHYSCANWLPFHWRGFTQTTRYSYVIEDLSDSDAIWNGLEGSARRNIRKAQKTLEVRHDLGVGQLLRLAELTYRRQGKGSPYEAAVLERVDDAARRRQQCRAFFAVDNDQRVHAGLYLVWDDESAYYLMGGVDDELGSSGAMSLVVWSAIRFASTVTRRFDFEGSIIESIERFFRKFGATQRPYSQLMHLSRRAKVLLTGHQLMRAVLGIEDERSARLLPL